MIDRSCCTPCVCIHTCAQAWRLFIDSISSYLLLVSEELDVETLKGILTDFAPRMGAKWDFIGIQLRQGDLVQELRASPQLGRQKVQQIIEEWVGSDDKHVPVCAATVSQVLRSKAVRLGAVAKEFEKVRANTILHCVWPLKRNSQLPRVQCFYLLCLPILQQEVQKRAGIQRADSQHSVSYPPHGPPPGAYPPAGLSMWSDACACSNGYMWCSHSNSALQVLMPATLKVLSLL